MEKDKRFRKYKNFKNGNDNIDCGVKYAVAFFCTVEHCRNFAIKRRNEYGKLIICKLYYFPIHILKEKQMI